MYDGHASSGVSGVLHNHLPVLFPRPCRTPQRGERTESEGTAIMELDFDEGRAVMLELFEYQEDGVTWLKQARNRLLAWQPGVGKTPPAVIACDDLAALKVLVLCPPIATGVWVKHFRDWTNYNPVKVFRSGA